MCAAGKSLPTTSRCGPISSSVLEEAVQSVPRQFVVHPDADDVIVQVQSLIAGKDRAGRRVEVGFVLQADVEIFDLRRPILIELDLEAAARGPAPMPLLLRNGPRRSDNIIRYVGDCAAGCRVEEPVVARVAAAAAEGPEPLLPPLVADSDV